MENPVIYIFINKSLGMSPGKIAAQAVHAAIWAISGEDASRVQLWRSSPHQTVIILQARDGEHLVNIWKYLKKRGYEAWDVIDEGVNETETQVYTSLSTKILDKDNEHVQKTFSTFELYQETIKVSMEIKR